MFNQLISSSPVVLLIAGPFFCAAAGGTGGAPFFATGDPYVLVGGLLASTSLGFTAPGPNVLVVGLGTPLGKRVTLLAPDSRP
jgi:hypothetical protein